MYMGHIPGIEFPVHLQNLKVLYALQTAHFAYPFVYTAY
jgi:hypothetical protein